MAEKKPTVKEKEASKETETAAKKKKSMIVSKPSTKISDLAPASP
jgi:hypothetical protein